MIRNFAYKTGVILLVALLITATGGFSLYNHFCHCAGEISSSVFMETACNHEDSSTSASSCCTAGESHSCCMQKPAEEAADACHDGDCCQTSVQFYKISDSFQPGLEKISVKPVLFTAFVMFIDLSQDVPVTPSCPIFTADLPPPESGKQIILAHHQLKLDPAQV
jgi:hypothetical protein